MDLADASQPVNVNGRKYDIGLQQVDQTMRYVNRGLGVIGPPVRFNCSPEITEITLVMSN